MLSNRQAQPGALLLGAAVGAIKGGKDVRQLRFVHTRPVVGNIHQPVFTVLIQAHLNGTALRAIIHGIADNVVESAVKIASIGQQLGRFGHFIHLQQHALLVLLGNGLAVFHQLI